MEDIFEQQEMPAFGEGEWEKRCHAKIGKNAMKARARGTEAQKHKCKRSGRDAGADQHGV